MQKYERMQLVCATTGLMLMVLAYLVLPQGGFVLADVARLAAWVLVGYAVLLEIFRDQAVP